MLYVTGFAFAMSIAFSGFMIHVGVGDVPVSRSSHSRVTPTSGGVGLIAALGGLFLILPRFMPPEWLSADWPLILSTLFAVGLLGLVDDVFHIAARVKFLLLAVLAALAVWAIGPVQSLPFAASGLDLPYVAGFAGSVLWIFVVTNAVNFMDGSNGMMVIVMGTACLALAAAAAVLGAFQSLFIPLALAAGLAGLMPYNARRRALVFAGDAGSLVVGFGFAISVLWLCREVPRSGPVYIGPVLLLPFLTDVLLTMLWRAKHGENLLEPHRRHLYQRLIARGHSHMAVALYYGFAAAALGGFAYVMAGLGYHRLTAFLVFPALILSAIYYMLIQIVTKQPKVSFGPD